MREGVPIEEIEKLMGPGEEEKPTPKDPLRSLSNARRTAIVLVSVGLGLVLFFITLYLILQERGILSGAAAGLIPLAIGIGFFVDYNLQKRELSRFGLEVGAESSGAGIGSVAYWRLGALRLGPTDRAHWLHWEWSHRVDEFSAEFCLCWLFVLW